MCAVGRADERLDGAVPGGPRQVRPVLDRVSTLRDALSALFEAEVSQGVVVDGEGRVVGLVGVEAISGALRSPGEAVTADRVAG